MNGKLGLTQAEAVMDLIAADGRQGAALANAALGGALAKKINAQKAQLTALQALMQHYHCPDLPFEPEMVEHTTVLALDVAAMTGKRRTSF